MLDPFFDPIEIYVDSQMNQRVAEELDWMLGASHIKAFSIRKAESLRQHMSSFMLPEQRSQSRESWIDQALQFATDAWQAKRLARARGVRIADAKLPCLFKFMGTGLVLMSRRYSHRAGCGLIVWDVSHTYPPGREQRGFQWCQRCDEYPFDEERHRRFMALIEEGFCLDYVENRSQLHPLIGSHLSAQDVFRFVGAQFKPSRVRGRINETADRIYTEALSLAPSFDSLEAMLREIF